MLCHIVQNMRMEIAPVMFVADLAAREWLAHRRVHVFCSGLVGILVLPNIVNSLRKACEFLHVKECDRCL